MLPSARKARSRWSWRRQRTQGSASVRSGSQDRSVDVLVEIPRGSRTKYELDQKTDLAHHWPREIETFFATYKELERNKNAEVKGWHDADSAWRLIEEARGRAGGGR